MKIVRRREEYYALATPRTNIAQHAGFALLSDMPTHRLLGKQGFPRYVAVAIGDFPTPTIAVWEESRKATFAATDRAHCDIERSVSALRTLL